MAELSLRHAPIPTGHDVAVVPPPGVDVLVGVTGPATRAKSGWSDLNAWLLYTPLVSSTFLSKFALPGGPPDMSMALPMTLAAALIGLVTGRMSFDPRRLMVYLVVVFTLGISQLVRGIDFSPTSFLLMATLYFAYVLQMQRGVQTTAAVLQVFSQVTSVIALCGLAQYASQFVVDQQFTFMIEKFVPESMRVIGYNNIIPLSYGAKIYKSNGFFLLEPSFFSQLMALALVAEAVSRNRMTRLALYVAAMTVAYSGTGIIILLICLPLLVIAHRRWDLILLGALLAVLAVLFADQLNLDAIASRSNEFGDRNSSGFHRFVGGFYLLDQFLWDDPWAALLGRGAGTYMSYAARATSHAAESALFKIIFEFGVLGSILNLGLLFYCVGQSKAPGLLRLGTAVAFFLNGIYSPVSHGIAFSLLIWPRDPGGEHP